MNCAFADLRIRLNTQSLSGFAHISAASHPGSKLARWPFLPCHGSKYNLAGRVFGPGNV
jgi:hypothetical protein